MSRPLTLGIVASPREWRSELQSYLRDHVSGVQCRVLREPRAAFEEHVDVVVIDDVASFLTRANITKLQERGVRVVGIFDPSEDEGRGQRFLDELGVDLTLTADAPPEQLLEGISALGPALRIDEAELDQFLEDLAPSAPPRSPTPRPGGPVLVAVGGPPGAPGATEVAIAAAASLAGRRERTVLVEVDETGPTLARRLLYQLEPNLLTSLHVLRRGGAQLASTLGTRASGAPGTVDFAVVCGLANVADWRDVREAELMLLLRGFLEAEASHVVAATGPHLEELPASGRERYGPSRLAIERADVVVGVCRPDPIGVLRFLDWAALVHERSDKALWVAVNRVPTARFKRAELEEQLRRNLPAEMVAGIVWLPEDPRVVEACWDGGPVARGPFTKAVEALMAGAVPRPVRARRRQGSERTAPAGKAGRSAI